jgi:hypothetical protein
LGHFLHLHSVLSFLCFFTKMQKITCTNKASGLSLRQQLLLRAVNTCLGLTSLQHRVPRIRLFSLAAQAFPHIFIQLSAKMLPNGRWVMPLLATCCPAWVGEAVHLADGKPHRSAGRRVGLNPPTFVGVCPDEIYPSHYPYIRADGCRTPPRRPTAIATLKIPKG